MMPCPKDGMEYIEIGDKAICPKCGHSRGYKQIDWIEVLTQNENMKRQQAYFIERIDWLEKIILIINKEAAHNTPKTAQD